MLASHPLSVQKLHGQTKVIEIGEYSTSMEVWGLIIADQESIRGK